MAGRLGSHVGALVNIGTTEVYVRPTLKAPADGSPLIDGRTWTALSLTLGDWTLEWRVRRRFGAVQSHQAGPGEASRRPTRTPPNRR